MVKLSAIVPRSSYFVDISEHCSLSEWPRVVDNLRFRCVYYDARLVVGPIWWADRRENRTVLNVNWLNFLWDMTDPNLKTLHDFSPWIVSQFCFCTQKANQLKPVPFVRGKEIKTQLPPKNYNEENVNSGIIRKKIEQPTSTFNWSHWLDTVSDITSQQVIYSHKIGYRAAEFRFFSHSW